MTNTFLAIASISETICVDKSTILPFASSPNKFLHFILSIGSSPAVGSSSISILGSFNNA